MNNCPARRRTIVSVIIPTLSRPALLTECLQSMMRQTWEDFEVIVVNDGGTPVEEVVAPHRPNVEVINNERNLGTSASLNRGVQACKGEFIALCDDDDLWEETHLEELLKVQKASPRPTLIYTDVVAVDSTLRKRLGLLRRDFDLETLRKTNFIVPSSILFAREIYDAIGGFDETLPHYWDWDFFLKVARLYSIQRLSQLLTYYRIHEQSHSLAGTAHDTSGDTRRGLERQRQLQMLSARHCLGDLPMKHLFDNFEKTSGKQTLTNIETFHFSTTNNPSVFR